MDQENGLVQVSVSLPKSLVPILPELMRVVTTAYCSSYSWDSMKLSVNNEVAGDSSSRVILNLGRCVTSDSEVVQGKLHRCREQVCQHSTPKDDLVGDVRITSFKQRTLKEHVKEMLKIDEEMEGTGWLEKELSDEMFFPSWYDQLRMNSVQHMGDGLFPPEKELNPSSPVIIFNNVGVHHYYESENDEFFPLKCTSLKKFAKKVEETSDETFRLKKVVDRAKNCIQEISSEERSKAILTPELTQTKIRQLKGRLNPSDICRTDVYGETFVYSKDDENDCSEEKDYSYRQYLCYDEDLPPYPLCDIDGSSNGQGVVCDAILPRVSTKKNRDLYDNFMRQQSQEGTRVQDLDRQKEDETLIVLSPTVKKTPFHRSFSANVVSHRFDDDYSIECSSSEKKREERKRPKSGPEKRVVIRSNEPDEFSHGDSRKLSDVQHILASGKSLPFQDSLMLGYVGYGQDQPKEKKKKRKNHHSPEKRIDEEKSGDIRKETTGHEHNRKTKDRSRKNDESERKDRATKLVISYKSHDEDSRQELMEGRSKHHKSDNRVETKHQHRKSKRDSEGTAEYRHKGAEQSTLKHEDLKDDVRRSRGRDEGKKSKRPKSAKTEQQTTPKISQQIYKTDVDMKSSTLFKRSELGLVKDDPSERAKSWKKAFLGKRFTPPAVIKEETGSSFAQHMDASLDDNAANKQDHSFLELISAVTDEVKQLRKKKEHKRIRDKIT